MALRTTPEVKGFNPPPLSRSPHWTMRAITAGAACSQPRRRPGARILENDPREMTLAEVQKAGGEALAVRADVSAFEVARALVEQALAKWGRIDVLVNTVGSFNWNPLVEVEPDEWRRIVATNLDSVFHMCRLVVPHMREKRFGRIGNFAAVGAAARAHSGANTTHTTYVSPCIARVAAF